MTVASAVDAGGAIVATGIAAILVALLLMVGVAVSPSTTRPMRGIDAGADGGSP